VFFAPPFSIKLQHLDHGPTSHSSADFAAHTVHMSAHFSALIIIFEPRHILPWRLFSKKIIVSSAPAPFAFSLQVPKYLLNVFCYFNFLHSPVSYAKVL
jgi:hypothetical protein